MRKEKAERRSAGSDSEKKYYDEAIDWEISRTLLIEKSERRAWFISMTLFVLLAISWAGLFFMLPLKKDTPYVVLVDKLRGNYKPIENYEPRNLGQNEVLDRYWLSRFIHAYEGYSYFLLPEDSRIVNLLSNPEVSLPYKQMYSGPSARQKEFKNRYRVEVEILSMLVRKNSTATVRLRLTQRDLAKNTVLQSKNFISEIRFGYESLTLTDDQRLVNPLGFRVKEYRRVADMD